MIFTSLQVLRNNYKFRYEPTNLTSKVNYAVHFLDYFYHTTLAKRFLNFMDSNTHGSFLTKMFPRRKSYITIATEFYTVDFYYFMSSEWCLLGFKVIEFTPLNPSVFRLKPYKKRSFLPRRSSISNRSRHLMC